MIDIVIFFRYDGKIYVKEIVIGDIGIFDFYYLLVFVCKVLYILINWFIFDGDFSNVKKVS